MTRMTTSLLLTTLVGAGAFLLPASRTSAQEGEPLAKKPTPFAVDPDMFLRAARQLAEDTTLDFNSRLKCLESAAAFLKDMKQLGMNPKRQDVQAVVGSSMAIIGDLRQSPQEFTLPTYDSLKRIATALGVVAETDREPALPLLLCLASPNAQVAPAPPWLYPLTPWRAPFGSPYNPSLPPWQRYVLSKEQRIAAITALGNVRAPEAVPYLTEILLRDPYPEAVLSQQDLLRGINAPVRKAAAIALGKIREETAIPYLALAGAADPNPDVRLAALEAIATIRNLPPPKTKD